MLPHVHALGGWGAFLGIREVRAPQVESLSDLVKGTRRHIDTYEHDYAAFVRNPDSGDPLPPLLDPRDLPHPPTVILVGGGLGNLVAAYELARCGFAPLVLEAEESLGGRLCTRGLGEHGELAEMGAASFPSESKLFWHYVRTAFYPHGNPGLHLFPGPGMVPTDVIWQGLRFSVYGDQQSEVPATLKRVGDKLRSLLLDLRSEGGNSLLETMHRMSKQTLDAGDKVAIREFWQDMVRRYDNQSLRSVVMAPPMSLTEEEEHAFATVGIGYGGFDALLDASFLELLRNNLWDNEGDYLLPDDVNTSLLALQLAARIWDQVRKFDPTKTFDDVFQTGAKVLAVTANHSEALVGYVQDDRFHEATADYVLVGMTNRAMEALGLADNSQRFHPARNRMFYSPFNSPFGYGNEQRRGHDIASSVRAGIKTQHMVAASTTWQVLSDPDTDPFWPKTPTGDVVRCTVSDTAARVSHWGMTDSGLALTSHTVGPASTSLESERGAGRLTSLAEQYDSPYVRAAYPTPGYAHLSRLVAGGLDEVTFDWQRRPHFRGGLKVDAPGGYYGTASVFWHFTVGRTTYAGEPGELPPYRRVFLTGDAVSFLGGWAEGAAMSGINAATGVLYQAAEGAAKERVRTRALMNRNPAFFDYESMGFYFDPDPDPRADQAPAPADS